MTPHTLSFALVVVHLCATLFMTGLIWFVQVVHYPLKSSIGETDFVTYQARHLARTGWVVGQPMLLEAASAAVLALAPPPGIDAVAITGLVLLILVWAATALFSVPAHGRLARGYDRDVHRSLVRTNWIRTWGWSARSAVALWMLVATQSTPPVLGTP